MPYFAHPVRVAMIVSLDFECYDPEVAAAALLHDVLEKTTVTAADLKQKFPPAVLDMVERLSKNCVPEATTYWQHLRASTWEVRLLKMADALDHFDCSIEDLPHRMDTGRQALALAFTNEPPLGRARAALAAALARANARLTHRR